VACPGRKPFGLAVFIVYATWAALSGTTTALGLFPKANRDKIAVRATSGLSNISDAGNTAFVT
jgi:hypothetical protein